VPTGPSLVGDELSVNPQGGLGGEGFRDDLAHGAIEVDEGYAGVLDVEVGIPTAAGEPYVRVVDALAEGEPLHCAVEPGDPVAVAADAIAALDPPVTASWLSLDGGSAGPLDAALALTPDAVVRGVTGTASDAVTVVLDAPADVPASPSAC
jgi:hypothetical protein